MSYNNYNHRPIGPYDDSNINLVQGRPQPPYQTYYETPQDQGSIRRYNALDPRGWSRKKLLWTVVGAVIVLIIIIVIAAVVSKKNKYPNYDKLAYQPAEVYKGASFFDSFDYFTGYDPTQGFVHYVDQTGSVAENLTFAGASSAILRVDTTDPNASTGRHSARISSKKQYDNGLFIFDVIHSPYGCGTWPALWLVDQANWPQNGEIDVAESVNQANTGNQMTLHTSDGCTMNVKRKETGKVLSNNCLNSTDHNAGCGVEGPPATFGEALNVNGGGVFAMELRSAGIRTWFFPRKDIPANIDLTQTSNTSVMAIPDPSTWPEPLADFPNTDCDITSHFRNLSIVANIDLCGTWAGNQDVYTTQYGCPGTCQQQVTSNNTAFETAYWEFGGIYTWIANGGV
ncbi:hypothetical protein MMC25_004052 [Agyrium rufum]|nr:hypothetical protein [Agyrium rufum]